MATTITMHAQAPSPSPAHLAAALSSIPTRPRSQLQNIELPPIRQAVPEIDLAPAPTAMAVETRGSSPYAQKRRMLTPESERGTGSQGHTPYRTSPRSAPGPPPLTVYAAEQPYASRGYPEPAPPVGPPRLFDPRADYPSPVYARDRYDAPAYPSSGQYSVYDGGGGKRGRDFAVTINGYPSGNGYVAEGYGGETGLGGGHEGKNGAGGRKRRGNLPKETTDKLRAWFVSHLHHPYPTEDEKQDLMVRTGLQMSEFSPSVLTFNSVITRCSYIRREQS